MITVVIAPSIGKPTVVATAETKPDHLRLPGQEDACGRRASRRTSMVLHCYFISFLCRGVGMVMQND
jgi:hypothetical protein